MSESWSCVEVDLIIIDYFLMLESELNGKVYSKTKHRLSLKKLLNNRSVGSIEFKHQNISAVLSNLGSPFIKGYKPRWNFQRILEDRIMFFLSDKKSIIEPIFKEFADSQEIYTIPNFNYKNFVSPPPKRSFIAEPKIELSHTQRPLKINYLLREQNNTFLGEKGEAFVMEYEKWRLIEEGKVSLADKLEWISKTDDGAGFDILSKNTNGTDRYIEVKTTKLSKETPIFFSKNEYAVSKEKSNQYFLYRVFNFKNNPKMFNIKGDFDSFCRKEVVQYKGFF